MIPPCRPDGAVARLEDARLHLKHLLNINEVGAEAGRSRAGEMGRVGWIVSLMCRRALPAWSCLRALPGGRKKAPSWDCCSWELPPPHAAANAAANAVAPEAARARLLLMRAVKDFSQYPVPMASAPLDDR